MKKLYIFLAIVLISAFGFVVASKVFGKPFDNAVGDQVVEPGSNMIRGAIAGITSHPIWVQWGHLICFTGGIFVCAVSVLFLIPKARKSATAQKVTTYMHKPTATAPLTLKKTVTAEPTAEESEEPTDITESG